MKNFIIYMIPGLLMLNACTEGRQGLSADQAAVIENSLVSGSEDSKNDGDTTAKAPILDGSDLPEAPPAQPSDDGSHTLAPGAHLGNGSLTATPAFPSDNGNGNQNGNDNNYQQVGPGFNFQKAETGIDQVRIVDPNHPNGYIQGYANDNDGIQSVTDQQVTAGLQPAAYDPFCNCYKTGPKDSSIGLTKDHPQFQKSGSTTQPVQATGSDEDDDDSDN